MGYNYLSLSLISAFGTQTIIYHHIPDSKVHGGNMGPTWVPSAPDGPRVGPMNLAIGDIMSLLKKQSAVHNFQMSTKWHGGSEYQQDMKYWNHRSQSRWTLLFKFLRVITLRPVQKGSNYADDNFKCIFLNEYICILAKISLNVVLKNSIDNKSRLV